MSSGIGRIRETAAACAAIAAIALAGCTPHGASQPRGSRATRLALDAPLPTTVPPDTRLTIGDPITQRVLESTGWIKELHFHVDWAQISGGPAVTAAFHAGALDVGAAADVPPIHAVWVGIPVRIIAVQLRRDPLRHPLFDLGVAPHAGIATLRDLRGKRIAFSPGQVQGEIVLRVLHAQGLTPGDVTLVELPSSGDVYINALASHAVDMAPLGAGILSRRYLDLYGRDGARVLPHGPFRDDLTVLYVRTATLRDPAKAAALREYVQLWARAVRWTDTHPQEWARDYWQQQERLSAADARYQVSSWGQRDVPRDWSQAVAIEQGAIDVLAAARSKRPFDARTLFDFRFEPLALATTPARSVASR